MENKRYTNCWPYWTLVAAAWLLLALAMSGCRSQRQSITTEAVSAVSEDSVVEVKARGEFSVFTADSAEVVFTADSVVTPRGVIYNPKARIAARNPRKGKREESVELSASHRTDSVAANRAATSSTATNKRTLPIIPMIVLLLIAGLCLINKTSKQ